MDKNDNLNIHNMGISLDAIKYDDNYSSWWYPINDHHDN